MDQTHHSPTRLKFGKECWVYYSVQPADGALLFVHGFHGNATDTWMQFQSLLQKEARCRRKDLYYFGYHSLRRSTASSSSWLFEFLTALAQSPEKLDGWPSRPDRAEYRTILVVAHSLGAIISRRAFLMAWQENEEWVSKLKLVLYAPAHFGGRPLKLIPKRIQPSLEFLFPTLEELAKDSETIKNLQRDTQNALKSRRANFLRAVKVIHGRKDNVVYSQDGIFGADPPCEWIDADHIQLCKPRDGFLLPLAKLREAL